MADKQRVRHVINKMLPQPSANMILLLHNLLYYLGFIHIVTSSLNQIHKHIQFI